MKLYWDKDNNKLVEGVDNPAEISGLTFVLRDYVDIELHVLQVATAGETYYEEVDLAAGRSIYFGAKPATALAGSHYIVAPTWVRTEEGIYTASIYLGQANLVAACTADLELLGEVMELDVSGNNYNSTQVQVTVKPDVNRGTESPVAALYSGCLVVEIVEDGQKVIILQNTDGVVYARFTIPGG
jgi:hypothetical protein